MSADWCQSVIRPINKNKAEIDAPNNYRGISLLSCSGKLFTSCLNRRLTIFIERNNIVQAEPPCPVSSDRQTTSLPVADNWIDEDEAEQAGFKSDFSTIDHLFVLKSLADMYLSKRQRLYCCFVDYKKTFDTINRTTLWSNMLSSRFSGKILMWYKTCI